MNKFKAVLSTIGKFHTFDMARELYKRGHLEAIFTAYPMFKLRHENLPQSTIHSFPWVHAPYMGFSLRSRLGTNLNRKWEYLDRTSFAQYVARHIPECDVFSGLSSSALETGLIVKKRGAKYICDRGSTHIRIQDSILREEHEHWGLPYSGIDPKIIDREEQEYSLADLITIPSTFNLESFLKAGVDSKKLKRVPYGVNLSRFNKTANPEEGRFNVLFVGAISLRKGIPYLLEAFDKIQHPAKKLTLVGSQDVNYVNWLRNNKLLSDNITLTGHMPQQELKQIMSASHVMVLPSVEEGLAMVQSQALACGCPVIASTNTGAADLFTDGEAGYIVPVRNVDALLEKLQKLADDPDLRATMSNKAMLQVNSIGGWSQYGNEMVAVMQELCE